MSDKASVIPINNRSKDDTNGAVKAGVVMTRSLTRLPAPIHQSREKLQRYLSQQMQSVFDAADDALFELADNASNNHEQNLYFESMREVRLQRRGIEKQLWVELDKTFANLLSSEMEESSAPVANSLENLSVLGNEELELQVAMESMVAKALKGSAEIIQQIGLRFSTLVPAKVQVSNNPVGPEVICKAFAAQIEPLDIDIKAQLVLLKLFDKHAVTGFSGVLKVINQLLIEQDILPALSSKTAVKRQSATSAVGSEIIPTTPDHESSKSAGDVQQNADVLNKLRGLLSGVSGSVSTEAMHPDTTSISRQTSSPANLQDILGYLQQQAAQAGAAHVSSHAGVSLQELIEQQLAQRSSSKLKALDQDVINLVNMLFEFILDDRNLPVPMKALIGRMQIPLLKVAINDQTFFNKASHPARRLLNELATAALSWQENAERQDPLYLQIEATINRLLNEFEGDTGLFDELLTDFLAFRNKERRRAKILERRTLDAEDGKAKAEKAREQVKGVLVEKMQAVELPEVAVTLLEGPWSNVMFLTCLKQGPESEAWQSALTIVDDLIWSVSASITREERSRLIKLLPDLLQRLRKGLDQISYNPFEMTQLLKRLEQVHLQQLKGKPSVVQSEIVKAEVAKSEIVKSEVNRLETVKSEQQSIELIESDKQPPKEKPPEGTIKASGPVENKAEAKSDQPVTNVSPSSADDGTENNTNLDEEYLVLVDRLSQGGWFEMNEPEGGRYRCRLAAIIKSVDKYIFVNRNGMKVAEKNKVELASALRSGKLRQLDDGMLFDRALESVIGSLRQSKSSV